ncbi:hypothetical protein [Halobacillus sp. Marseille-Q1614]|uniref:hypothetical protein n=1 Tax=Halobacillus sp. Marseille-Q1614 TaxID=2709134 RepID=UPI00156EAD3F|nr:hypothetical protein [Halobacillus sp. Marseille-Q1614]
MADLGHFHGCKHHPADKSATIDLFRTLKKGNEEFEPNEIRSWLIIEAELNPKFADDIRDIAKEVSDGKQINGDSFWNESILTAWRTRAKQRDMN